MKELIPMILGIAAIFALGMWLIKVLFSSDTDNEFPEGEPLSLNDADDWILDGEWSIILADPEKNLIVIEQNDPEKDYECYILNYRKCFPDHLQLKKGDVLILKKGRFTEKKS